MHKRPVLTTHQIAYRFDAFELRPGRQLLRDGSPVSIGSTALEVLRMLVTARGELVTKNELFEAIWSDASLSRTPCTNTSARCARRSADRPT